MLLIVDDDPSVGESLSAALEASGLEVAIAGTGEEAITLSSTRMPQAALVDYNLPGLNGAEVTRRIHNLDPAVPVIGFSAEERRREEMLAAGAAEFMAKPVDVGVLLESIRELAAKAT
jgi:DNA-binding response OmpR family regulator